MNENGFPGIKTKMHAVQSCVRATSDPSNLFGSCNGIRQDDRSSCSTARARFTRNPVSLCALPNANNIWMKQRENSKIVFYQKLKTNLILIKSVTTTFCTTFPHLGALYTHFTGILRSLPHCFVLKLSVCFFSCKFYFITFICVPNVKL